MNLDRFSQTLEHERYLVNDLSFIVPEEFEEEETCRECGVREPLRGEEICIVCAEA